MRTIQIKADAVALIVAVFLLASTATVAAAHAQMQEQLLQAKSAQLQPAFAVSTSSLLEVKKMQNLMTASSTKSLMVSTTPPTKSLMVSFPKKPETSLQKYATHREQLKPKQLKELLGLVGFEGKALKQAWAIAMKESTGRPTSHNKNSNTGDNSYGLFQINMIGGLGEDRRNKFDLKQNEELFNPVRNAEIAYHMSNGGEDFGAWGLGPNAYNGGKVGSYYKWLDQYPED
jgi:hypothetical protein